MSKKVAITTRPTNKAAPEAAADAWVEKRASNDAEGMKRLTIDIPESLHRRIKAQCALNGKKIADEVREMLLQKFGNS